MVDLLEMNADNLPGFSLLGYRCKSLTICAVSQGCVDYDTADNLGSLQSGEAAYYDGSALAEPESVKLRIGAGAQTQCGDPDVVLNAGENIDLTFESGQATVYFPAFTGNELILFIAADGATYHDAALTQLAQPPP
jgi:hypothetical protein